MVDRGMETISYALCECKCRKSKNCLRYINRKSGQKAIINFKQVCNANNGYKWLYKNNNTKVEKRK